GPVAACGVGLFSDGYINSVIGSVKTILSAQYGKEWKGSDAKHWIGNITFLGTVVGMLLFGYTSDKWSRTNTLMASTVVIIVFTILVTATFAGDDHITMFNMLVAFRFFVGIGVGGEYPAGSVAAAEGTKGLKAGTRNMWISLVTNAAIDWGFVIGALVPYILAVVTTNYDIMWRVSLGLGVLLPCYLLFLRSKLKEPEEYTKHSMRHAKVPYGLVFRYYGVRLFAVASIWFLYDFVSYSFDIFSSAILANLYDDNAPLTTVFGWNTVINFMYIPGAMLGAPLADRIGGRWTMIWGLGIQAILGYILAGTYASLAKPALVGLFSILFGIFLSLGELGPGNCTFILGSQLSATGVRGQFLGVAAAVGKLGAFLGTYIFPYVVALGGDSDVLSAQYPFYVASSLSLVACGIAYFLIPEMTQDQIALEDERFRAFLEENNYDTRQLGLKKGETVEGK
ncbi:major facilitator superfamily domain-containing protein, partial [Chytriomyces sp. MP71]